MDAHLLRALAGVSVVFAVACDGRTPPNPISSTPVPSVSPAPTPSATVSGTVLIDDASGVTRRANGWMFGWVQTEREGRTTGQAPTDADGRFRFAVPLGAQVRLQGSTPGAFQPCQVVVRAIPTSRTTFTWSRTGSNSVRIFRRNCWRGRQSSRELSTR